MEALVEASIVLIAGALGGLVAAALYTVVGRRARDGAGVPAATVLRRAASYAGLAAVLLAAAWTGVPGIAVLVGAIGGIGLLEWSDLFDLPVHHRIGLLIADVAIVSVIAINGVGGSPVLVGGLVLVGALWPVIRADTDRAIRDLGYAAVGCVLIPVLLVHGVALRVEAGPAGAALFVAVAVGCALSDVGAFVVGRAVGGPKLAPRLSPNKTWAGVLGNVAGAAVGVTLFAPGLAPAFGAAYTVALVPLIAVGSVWGDLLESAVKREAGVKDAATWLPGFGGILDRVDSLLITIALAYWVLRLAELR
jgi:phosphatidate cytidylyltransferase